MERELEEMHEAVDQALRAALMGLGSVRERKARSDQVKADQARVAASADRSRFEAYQQAQDAMLRAQLSNVTDSKWWDTSSPADIAATVDLAERYADVSPYAEATLTNLRSEAERRGVDLTPPPAAAPTHAADPYIGADARTPAQTAAAAGDSAQDATSRGQDGDTVSLKKAGAFLRLDDELPDEEREKLAGLMTRYDEQSRGYAALNHSIVQPERPRGPAPEWGPGNAEWDEAARGYMNNLDAVQHEINAFGEAGFQALSRYLSADDEARREVLQDMHEPVDRTSTADHSNISSLAAGPAAERHATEVRGYERSRASDMTGADPEHVQTRLAVAKSFIHPIRTYTRGHSKTGGGEGSRAPSRRQQLKRGK